MEGLKFGGFRGKALAPWQVDAVKMCWHMVEKAEDMKIEAFSQQRKLASPERSTQCSTVLVC